MFHVRLLQLRFIQHLQSDYVFRLLLARQVHVAEFPATERFAYIEVFQLLTCFITFAFVLKEAAREEKSVKLYLSLLIIYFSSRQSDWFSRVVLLLKSPLHQNRFEKFKFLNDRRTKKREFSSVGEIIFTCHRFSPVVVFAVVVLFALSFKEEGIWWLWWWCWVVKVVVVAPPRRVDFLAPSRWRWWWFFSSASSSSPVVGVFETSRSCCFIAIV